LIICYEELLKKMPRMDSYRGRASVHQRG